LGFDWDLGFGHWDFAQKSFCEIFPFIYYYKMPRPALYAPWRMDYIKSLGAKPSKDDNQCFLCEAAAANEEATRRDRLVLWQTDLVVVLLNRYPYANGHLLVAPRQHKAELEDLTDDECRDITTQTRAAVKLLKTAVSAQGFNIGINLGRIAGAGVPGHLHQHIVPRWGGDVNFMHVVGDISIIPQATTQMWEELVKVAARTQ
jgi:ATP adenylyltransferase